MAATDYITLVYQKLRALLEAHTPFTLSVKVGNRIWWDAGRIVPYKPNKAVADFPESLLELGGGQESGFTLNPTYRNQPGAAVSSLVWKEEHTESYILTLTHPDLRIGSDSLLDREAMTALRKGGPRLGLAYVKQWGPISKRREWGVIEGAGGTFRMRTVFTIPVTMLFDGSDLIT